MLGADEDESGDSISDEDEQDEEEEEQEQEQEEEQEQEQEEEEEEEDDRPAATGKALQENSAGVKKSGEHYEVGDFVTAVYEGQWHLAQVDIDQDHASSTHVNLTYMERAGKNQFKWPKHDDRLLTLKEDILFKCSTPVLVGSTIRARNVGLPGKEAEKADAALELVVYLQQTFFRFCFQIFPEHLPYRYLGTFQA
jgi:hypothetical protein